jgi:hypothetical protein
VSEAGFDGPAEIDYDCVATAIHESADDFRIGIFPELANDSRGSPCDEPSECVPSVVVRSNKSHGYSEGGRGHVLRSRHIVIRHKVPALDLTRLLRFKHTWLAQTGVPIAVAGE